MGRVSSLLRQWEALEDFWCDEANRFVDLGLRFCEVDRVGRRVGRTGRVSRVYGGRWDRWAVNGDGSVGAYCAEQPADLRVHEIECNPTQFDLCTDDQTPHFLVIGSRGSGKTELLARFKAKAAVSWPGFLISCMVEKRAKARRLIQRKFLPLLPEHWIRGTRWSSDDTAVSIECNSDIVYYSAKAIDGPRGDGVPVFVADETQLAPREAIENAFLSMREGGTRYQTLETGTLVEGEFEEYVERCRGNPLYRVVALSVTDNIHLDTAFDEVTGCEIPAFVISARSMMDPKRFKQEVGLWDPERKRFVPQVAKLGGRIYYAFEHGRHVRRYDAEDVDYVERTIRELFGGTRERGVGEDITRAVGRRKFGRPHAQLFGVTFEFEPMASVVCRVFRGPRCDVLWVIDEIGLDDEADGTLMAEAWADAGYHDGGAVPDAAGWRASDGGKGGIRMLREAGYEVHGPKRNPKDRDRHNSVNAKLLNGARQVQLIVDPRCQRLLAALKTQRRSRQGVELTIKDGNENFAHALGYLIDYFWPAAVAIDRLTGLTAA